MIRKQSRYWRGRVATFVTGLAIAGSVLAAQSQQQSTPAVRLKTFDVVWKTINNKFFDPTFNGIDWAGIRTRYAPRVMDVETDQELHGLLDQMIQELGVSHLRVYDIDTLVRLMARSEVNTGLVLRDLGDEVVVTRVLQASSAQKAGLRTGYVIKQLNGVAVTNARQAEFTIATENKEHELQFVDENGTTRQATLAHQLPPAGEIEKAKIMGATWYSRFESRRLDGGIGYVRFTNFIPPIKKRAQAAFNSMNDAPGIILDLRGNTGGVDIGPDVAGMILNKPAQLAITRTRRGDDNYYKAKPGKKPFLGPVVILVDEESRSESEALTAGLQELGRVTVIGKKSRGLVMDATLKELPTGALMLYPIGQPRTPKGFVIEGRGVVPDLEVSLTRAELLKGWDSQLQTAIDYIQERKGSALHHPVEVRPQIQFAALEAVLD